ncbi:MAG: outer membrane lipoprotein carrier protein LolA [Thermodesulfobacteriota bacterium]
MRRIALLTLPVLAVLAAAAARAGEPPGLLDRLERSMAGVRTVQAEFVQEKTLAMLREPLRAEGRLCYAAPDRLRWEYTAPEAQGFSMRGSAGRRWDPAGEARGVDLARDPVLGPLAGELLAWVKFDLAHIRAAYAVEVLAEDPPVLRLRPQAPLLGRVLDRLDLAFAPDLRSVVRVEYREPDGDATAITFHHMVLDAPLGDGLF